MVVFTVANGSPRLFVKKGLLYLVGDAPSKAYTVQGIGFMLSQGMLEWTWAAHLHGHRDGPLRHC